MVTNEDLEKMWYLRAMFNKCQLANDVELNGESQPKFVNEKL